jgi:hypothetical protein
MTTTLQILTAARELLSDEARWTKAYLAKTLSERPCDPRAYLAVCWCAMGAIDRAAKRNTSGAFEAGLTIESVIYKPIAAFNDDPATTHADVLKAFDRAIEKAKSE